MKKYLLIFAFACLAYTHAQAQTQDSTKKKDMDRLTWEIAYNALPLLNWNGGNGQSILFRKNVEKYPKGQLVVKHRAYRLKVNLAISHNSPTRKYTAFNNTINSYTEDGYHFSGSLETGYEYQHYFKKFQFYYGLDAVYNLMLQKTAVDGNSNSSLLLSLTNTTHHSGGVKPFLGFKYFINKNFSVSTETNLYLLYTIRSQTYEFKDPNQSAVTRTEESTSSQISSNTNYLSSVYVSFHF